MKCSNLIGVLKQEKSKYKEVNGETFYKSEIVINESTYPVLYSEHTIKNLTGRIKLVGYLRSERLNNKLETFVYISSAVSTTEEDNDTIMLEGVVHTAKDFKTCVNGLDIKPFILKYTSYDSNVSIVHCIAKDKMARILMDLHKGDVVELNGVLKASKGAIEVDIREYVSCRPMKEVG